MAEVTTEQNFFPKWKDLSIFEKIAFIATLLGAVVGLTGLAIGNTFVLQLGTYGAAASTIASWLYLAATKNRHNPGR